MDRSVSLPSQTVLLEPCTRLARSSVLVQPSGMGVRTRPPKFLRTHSYTVGSCYEKRGKILRPEGSLNTSPPRARGTRVRNRLRSWPLCACAARVHARVLCWCVWEHTSERGDASSVSLALPPIVHCAPSRESSLCR